MMQIILYVLKTGQDVRSILRGKGMLRDYLKPYVARIGKGRKHIGYYGTPEEAHHAWQEAKAKDIRSKVSEWELPEEISEALLARADKLEYDAAHGIETKSL